MATLDLIRPAHLPLHCASASTAPCSASARRPRSGLDRKSPPSSLGRRSSPSRQEEGSSRIQGMAFFSRCSRRPCPARGGAAAGGAHPATKVAAVEGFLHLNLDLHGVVVQPLKFKGRRGR